MSARPLVVLGAGGQLGSALLRRAGVRNIAVVGLTRAQCDIADKASVADALWPLRPAAIINAAAYTAVDRAESERDEADAVNHRGATLLSEAAHALTALLLHVSTDYVFDGTKQAAYREDDPIAPLGIYGATKAQGEAAVLQTSPHGALILRTAWVYGREGANFVKTMLRLASERDLVRVVNDQRGSPTFADDLADALLDLASRASPTESSRVYHLANLGAATWFEVAREIFAETARRGLRTPRLEAITTAEYPTPAKRPANSVLDCSLIKRDFGIALPQWRDGLHRMLAHLDAAS